MKRFPESVMAPAAVTTRLPLTVLAPRSIVPVSLSVTLLPLTTETAPPKSLALPRVMSFAVPALKLVVPAIVRTPELVMLPPASVAALLVLIASAPASVRVLSTAPPVPVPAPVFTVSVMPVPAIVVASAWLKPWAPAPSWLASRLTAPAPAVMPPSTARASCALRLTAPPLLAIAPPAVRVPAAVVAISTNPPAVVMAPSVSAPASRR